MGRLVAIAEQAGLPLPEPALRRLLSTSSHHRVPAALRTICTDSVGALTRRPEGVKLSSLQPVAFGGYMQRSTSTWTATFGALMVMCTVTTGAAAATPEASAEHHYDFVVQRDQPVGYWPQRASGGTVLREVTGRSPHGEVHGSPGVERMPNGDKVLVFDGDQDYVEIADADTLGPAATGLFTVEAWLRPDALTFRNAQSDRYVHWMGKGEKEQHEWVSRIYSDDNTVGRENRISGYLFNLDGGLGAGSYYQQQLQPGQWLHYVLVINSEHSSGEYPAGYTKVYIDGTLSDTDSLIYDGTQMVPGNGSAPLRIGTRDFASFFEGAIGKVAIYDYELSAEDIAQHHASMHG